MVSSLAEYLGLLPKGAHGVTHAVQDLGHASVGDSGRRRGIKIRVPNRAVTKRVLVALSHGQRSLGSYSSRVAESDMIDN